MTPATSSPRTSPLLPLRRRRVAALACVAALALAGCGSTVPTTGEDGVLSLDGSSAMGGPLGAPGGALDAQGNPIDPSDPAYVAGGGGGSTSGSGSSSGAAAGGSTSATGGPTASSGSPSVSAGAPVKVGYLVIKDAGAAFAALGYDLSTGDGRTQAQAAVDLINKSGGVGGHKVDPVFFEIDAAGDVQAQFVESCSFFFEDNDIRALVAVYSDDQVRACAQKAGVPVVDVNVSVPQSTMDTYANVVKPGHPATETAAAALVDGLVAQGWFKPASASETVKVGLLTHDTAAYENVEPTVVARLKAAGLTLASTYEMPEDDVAAASAAGRSAALRFSSDGVNRVVAVDRNGFALSWFGLSAAGQGYYPRLGLSTLSNPVLEPTVLEPRALEGAAGIGWSPVFDALPSRQPATSARTGACVTAMDAAGQDMDSSGTRQGSLLACEGTFFLADAWRSGETTLAAFLAGTRGLGTKYQAVTAFATDFARSRAGASGYQGIKYAAGCDCFEYVGSTRSFG